MNMRQKLEERARELGCFPDPENRTDIQLLDAIKAETAAAAWLARLEQSSENGNQSNLSQPHKWRSVDNCRSLARSWATIMPIIPRTRIEVRQCRR